VRVASLLLVLLGLLAAVAPLVAEQFVSLGEAQRLCFTNATRFEEVKLRLTSDEIKAIEGAARVKVKNPAPRVWRAWQEGKLLGTVWFDQVTGKHELIDYVVAVSPAGVIRHVEIVEYREHYGGQVRRRDWLDQFKGKTKDAPLKFDRDIRNISGATMSCRHVTEGVERIRATCHNVRARVVGNAAGGLPNESQ
jgi:Na+-translocating ferredoxin:NAD+ oxidoreductase RnfG subunit